MEHRQDHVFISYAWESAALAEWLARKLTSLGYAVWVDRFKLLGGDWWPDKIDEAIKERSFCLVQLITRGALERPNPSSERQLALGLQNKRKRTFFIPLNVDGIAPTELPWQMSTIQYIPFQNWADGLSGLLTTLESLHCPKPRGDGSAMAIGSYQMETAIKNVPEKIFSNCYPVAPLPDKLLHFRAGHDVKRHTVRSWNGQQWPCWSVNSTTFLSFVFPPDGVTKDFRLKRDGQTGWRKLLAGPDRVQTENVVKALVRRSFDVICHERGLRPHQSPYYWFFTPDITKNGYLHFSCYTGKRNRIRALGERKVRGKPVRYALAFVPYLRDDIGDGLTVQIKVRLHLMDRLNVPLAKDMIISRRKAITANWWNHEWLLRQEAIMSFLSADGYAFGIGQGEHAVSFSAKPLTGECPTSLDDVFLDALKVAGKSEQEIREEEVASQLAGEDDGDEP